ncbi:hypothetical protein ACH44C_01775 [Streptomyces purpureus]|uniref:hypothetical protein n=1 Tax=Streptomyces purpureus TaxID=1951 RepID=UPI0003731F8F|nr:hypothetical protein [Streptomyces purpureus]
MTLRLPNSFSCTSRTAVLESEDPIDFRPLAQPGLPERIAARLVTRRFLVTRSHVRSTVSGDHTIDFSETLVKIPVRVGERSHLFPVVTYVDHEYSLIRGYLLGFHKLLAPPAGDGDRWTTRMPGFDVDLRAEGDLPGGEADLPPEQSHPFLLWTDYAVGEAHSHGLRTLTVERYERQRVGFLRPARPEKQTAANGTARVASLYEIVDRFDLTGVKAVDG